MKLDTGVKPRWRAGWGLLVAAACLLGPSATQAAEKNKAKAPAQAILFGSVFQENGFSLRGARVVVTNADRPKDRKETVTNIQGEFAVRVPAGKARYTVEASAPGFAADKKTVEVTGEERIDLTFRLAPAPK